MKPFLFFLFPLFFACSLTAQRSETFLDYQEKPVPVEKALFYATTENIGEFYYRKIFYIREDILQMEGFYTDAACKQRQGLFYYFYPSGKIRKMCGYNKNKLSGRYINFYENGLMKDSAQYDKGNMFGHSYSWYPDAMLKDSTLLNQDGSGSRVSWHRNGEPSSAGYFAAGGKLRGTWQYFHRNGKTAAREQYQNGQVVDKKYFDSTGKVEDTSSTDRVASFPGGEAAWEDYIASKAIIPAGWESTKSGDIIVLVTAIIDEEGNVYNAYVLSPYHPAFDKLALKLVESAPRWIPAIEHHRLVETEISFPVKFVRAK